MNYAVIIAGGVGSRMKQAIPKQFINIYGKPILIYTLEAFEENPLIDKIIVVCIKEWIEILKSYCKKYHINKILHIVEGGSTGQESIRNGVYSLKGIAKDDDNIIIHDGIRPVIEQEIINDVIRVCNIHGNAVTSLPYNEQIFLIDDDISTTKYIKRETLRRVSTPQAYKFDKLYASYQRAFKEEIGIYGSSYTNTMMVELGERLFFAAGSEKNIKLTTPDDIEIFKSLLKLNEKES